MLIYLNSEQKLPIGSAVIVPNLMLLFQEHIHATAEAFLDKNNKVYTYAAIIDDTIHDPLVIRQIDAVYVSDENGMYPSFNNKNGIPYKQLVKIITNINTSLNFFLHDPIMEQIKNFGFNAVWVFDNYSRQIVTLNPIEALIIKKI